MPDPYQSGAAGPAAQFQVSRATVLREWGRIGCIGSAGRPARGTGARYFGALRGNSRAQSFLDGATPLVRSLVPVMSS